MLAVRDGNLDAFEALVLRHQGEAWRVACWFIGDAAEAEDLAQQVPGWHRVSRYPCPGSTPTHHNAPGCGKPAAVTIMIGFLPLALNLEEGGDMLQPMAVAVIGDVGMEILVALFLMPCMYVLFTHARRDITEISG